MSCTTTSCTANSLSCSTYSQGNWNEFSQYILGSSSIYAVNIGVPWASVDTGYGTSNPQYDFTAIDAQIQYYTTNYPNKKVNLMWLAINYSSINNPGGGVNQMTPAYVFTTSYASTLAAAPQDVAYCTGYPGNGTFSNTIANAATANFDSTGYPVVYEAPFMTAYQNFIKAVIQHYNGNSTIGYMRFGLSVGDEAQPYCTDELPNWNYPDTWSTYVGDMDTLEGSQKPQMRLMESLNAVNGDITTLPSIEAGDAVSNGFGFGSNGWQQSDISAIASGDLTGCTSDWCALFKQYASSGVPLELQPAVPSDDQTNNITGNLATLISQSAAVEYATVLEISQDDLYLALQSGYTPPDGDASPAASYASAIDHPCNEPPN